MLYQGQWMTRDEAMREQGYIKYKGKYLTQQEIDLREKTSAQRAGRAGVVSEDPAVEGLGAWAAITGRQIDGLEQLTDRRRRRRRPRSPGVPVRCSAADPEAALRGPPDRHARREARLQSRANVTARCRLGVSRQAAFEGLGDDQREAAIPYYVECAH